MEGTTDQKTELSTPVLFLVFNRPTTTARVFDVIREARPRQLFIAADGPRENKPGEAERCIEVRQIVSRIDWPCDVKTLFRTTNAGCGRGVSEAITWFFDHVEEGIILEDDCLPSQDFFLFCSQLLERYRDDQRIMQIGGNNLQTMRSPGETASYFFSDHNFIWGWATWRRAWKFYDFQMLLYPQITRKRYHDAYFHSMDERDYFRYVLHKTFYIGTNTWDYQWQFTRMLQSGLVVVPWKNLVVNIGFGEDATHTVSQHDILPGQKLQPMEFPLTHPEFVMVDKLKDAEIFKRVFTTPWSRIRQRIKKFVPQQLLRYRSKLLSR